MKKTINGVEYNSKECEALAYITHSCNDVWCGVTRLLRSKGGELLVISEGNGLDPCFVESFDLLENSDRHPELFRMTTSQRARCEELGIIDEARGV